MEWANTIFCRQFAVSAIAISFLSALLGESYYITSNPINFIGSNGKLVVENPSVELIEIRLIAIDRVEVDSGVQFETILFGAANSVAAKDPLAIHSTNIMDSSQL